MTIKKIVDRIDLLDEAITKLTAEMAQLRSMLEKSPHRMPEFHREPKKIEPPRELRTLKGLRVGERCWAVRLPLVTEHEVKAGKVVALSSATTAFVLFDGDRRRRQLPGEYVFPYTEQGRQSAQALVVDEQQKAWLMAAERSAAIVYANSGDLSLLGKLDHRSLMKVAAVVGLTQFRELKGLKAQQRLEAIRNALVSYRANDHGSEVKAAQLLLQFHQEATSK